MKISIKIAVLTVILLLLFSGCETETESKTEVTKKTKATAKSNYVVCIDAGHGFGDPGCESEFLNGTEAEINLSLTNLLKNELKSLGITVLTTHNGYQFPNCYTITSKAQQYNIYYDSSRIIENNVFSAYERVIYASVLNKETPINLFISLHTNSLENHPEVSRYELYYYKDNPYSDKLSSFCSTLSECFDNETVITATEADESYTVTRYTDFPSILLEAGYATNRTDADKLNSPEWRKEFCKTLAKEICLWLKEVFE